MDELLLAKKSENQPLLVNDIQVLASELNDRMLQAQQQGCQLQVSVKEAWRTSEPFMRKLIVIRVWQEVQ
jgi:hypothetical protein